MKRLDHEAERFRYLPGAWVLMVVTIFALTLGVATAPRAGATTLGEEAAATSHDRPVSHEGRVHRLTLHIENHYSVPAPRSRTIVDTAFSKGTELGISPELILAIIAVESTFRERAVSRAGARGLMQIVPKWHPEQIRDIGGVQALFDPRKNIHAGTQILAKYLHLSSGDMRKALLRYNGSLKNPRSRYADKVLSQYRSLRQASSV